MTKSLKMEGFKWASVLGFIAFGLMAFRMPTENLVTLCQFYFGYQGVVSGGFFGFRAWEQTANGKKVAQ